MSIYNYQLLKGLGLSEQRVARLLPQVHTATYHVNRVLQPKGSKPTAWIHLLSGLVSASVPEADGAITPVNIYGEGTWFGEAAILSQQPSALEYISLSTTRCLSLPLACVLEAFEQEPDFARYIARMVAWRNQQHTEVQSLLRSGSPALRVVMGMALFAENLNSSASHLPTNGHDSNTLNIPIKQALLASMCGVSRGIFSECVQQLAAAGWLRIDYGTLGLLRANCWLQFSANYRQARVNQTKPKLPDLMRLLAQAVPGQKLQTQTQPQPHLALAAGG